MKLLHTIRSLDPREGGVVALTRDLVRAGLQRGDRAVVCTLDAPDAPWLKDWPGEVHAIGPAGGMYGFSRRFVPWVRVHAEQFDGIVAHGLWQQQSFGTWRALAGAEVRVPYVVFPHGMLDGWFRAHQPVKHFKKMFYWPLEHFALRDAKAVCFTAEEERRNSRDSFWPYEVKEVVVGAGIEPPPAVNGEERAFFYGTFPQLQNRPCILYLGRIHLKKGCDLLAQAFAQCAANLAPDVALVFAGPDAEGLEPQLRALVPKALQERMIFTGMLTGELKWAALRTAEVFIIPSHQENFCLAAAEALACGVPALVSDKVNIWREIVESGAGFVAPDTLEGTTALLRRWAGTSPAERKAMGAAAQDCFAKHFSIGRLYEKLSAIFTL